MDPATAQKFAQDVLAMPLAWRERMRHSPSVSAILIKHGNIEAMNQFSLSLLRTAILNTLTVTFRSLIAKLPSTGEVVVGTSARVPLSIDSLQTLLPGRNLNAEALRAVLVSDEWSFPANTVLVDPVSFKVGNVSSTGEGVHTILFPVQAPLHWLLLVVKLLAGNAVLGLLNVPDADLWICDPLAPASANLGSNEGREEAIDAVIRYLRHATDKQSFSCVKSSSTVAGSNLADTGIATAVNALSILQGRGWEEEMGEVRCWDIRERVLRRIVESASVENAATPSKPNRNPTVEDDKDGGDDAEPVVPASASSSQGQSFATPRQTRKRSIRNAATVKDEAGVLGSVSPPSLQSLDGSTTRQTKKEDKPQLSVGSSLDCRWMDD
ncbi:hypothetical protein BJ878DRAFT_510562 [Calycina marina]|uniref:Uncharacterized protein n=1 Tax=Calycina marina TaxID=1763456 RepID=A0A9P7Z170_9HELO|nr:hypothetical protein BJ878DRAFT_510562 [Calycina marina]